MSDGWTFTPDADETVDVPDANFLNYGFWLKKTTDEDGELTYNEVETFAGASAGLPASGSVGDVTGSASYDGEAVGRVRSSRPERGRRRSRFVPPPATSRQTQA